MLPAVSAALPGHAEGTRSPSAHATTLAPVVPRTAVSSDDRPRHNKKGLHQRHPRRDRRGTPSRTVAARGHGTRRAGARHVHGSRRRRRLRQLERQHQGGDGRRAPNPRRRLRERAQGRPRPARSTISSSSAAGSPGSRPRTSTRRTPAARRPASCSTTIRSSAAKRSRTSSSSTARGSSRRKARTTSAFRARRAGNWQSEMWDDLACRASSSGPATGDSTMTLRMAQDNYQPMDGIGECGVDIGYFVEQSRGSRTSGRTISRELPVVARRARATAQVAHRRRPSTGGRSPERVRALSRHDHVRGHLDRAGLRRPTS